MEYADLIVVVAGVLGTFHAFHAARLGLKTILIEKDFALRTPPCAILARWCPGACRRGSGSNLVLKAPGFALTYHPLLHVATCEVVSNGVRVEDIDGHSLRQERWNISQP